MLIATPSFATLPNMLAERRNASRKMPGFNKDIQVFILILSILSIPVKLFWALEFMGNIQYPTRNIQPKKERLNPTGQSNPKRSRGFAVQRLLRNRGEFKFCEICYSIDACIFTLDIGYSVLDIGYSPAGLDTALRDGILNIQICWVVQEICASGYWDWCSLRSHSTNWALSSAHFLRGGLGPLIHSTWRPRQME